MGRLSRMMANRKGTSEKKRKLYCNIINLIVLYGVPIWAEEVNENPKIAKLVRSVQRRASLRVIRAYRTISMETSLILARNPPVELLASKMKAVHERKRMGGDGNVIITERGINLIKKQEQEKMMGEWKKRVTELVRREKVKGELLTCFNEWMRREHGELTFWATQLITGHGCFRAYTYRIGKFNRMNCDFCNAVIDDNIHTLVECNGWTEERNRLTEALNCRVSSLRTILQGITGNERKWHAFIEFCSVMGRKEQREREEQSRERRERIIEEAAVLVGTRYRGRMT